VLLESTIRGRLALRQALIALRFSTPYLLERTKSTVAALFCFTVTDFSQVFGWVKIGR
jgi:hypothetical protein